ncbi:MAG: NAD(P)H-hydrate dehydratase [Candidatus Bipolaricaulota bacterium]
MIRGDETLVITAAEQRRLDDLAVKLGVGVSDLVESAGRGAAEWIERHVHAHRIAVFAGPGGNGADALVVARALAEKGLSVRAFLVGDPERRSAAARDALERLEARGIEATPAEPGCAATEEALTWASAVVDGLTGTGLSRPLDGAMAELAEGFGRSEARVVSLDVPSGVLADVGDLNGPAVRADVTLAMFALKPAHLLFPAAGLCGNVAVVSVAYPERALQSVVSWARVAGRPGVRRRLPMRRPDGHKGTFGRVLVVAGSRGMTGSAILACRSALRAGAGLVTLVLPASLAPIANGAAPEVITVAAPERDGALAAGTADAVGPQLARADVLAIGPGLGRDLETSSEIVRLLGECRGPVVLDADAFVALRGEPARLAELGGRVIATPHPGELALWTGEDAAGIDRRRVQAARQFADRYGVLTLLKGRPTVIAEPEGSLYLNPTGNSGLATAGSGDVLTGMLAGLLAGGASPPDAAVTAAFVHGLAAERFASTGAERSLVASDVVDLLPAAFREVERCD